MNRQAHLLVPVFLAGCAGAPSSPALDARVRALEIEVAQLRAQRQTANADGNMVSRANDAKRIASAGCKDVSIPSGTQIDIPVAFEAGTAKMQPGDRITITEVRGTRGDFAIGGAYLVRGEYTLASADEATLGLSVGATDPTDACTSNNNRGRQHVSRGSGKFELATTFVHSGYPGVSFFIDGVDGSGGRLFGKGSSSVQFGKGDLFRPR
jgi:hypothetical protein